MTYQLVRFKIHNNKEVLAKGLPLEVVQSHCNREDTHGDGWFDGYEKEGD